MAALPKAFHALPEAGAINLGWEAARLASDLGWPVFPCRPDKSPYTFRGHKDASTNPATIAAWWSRWPNALIGVPTGPAIGAWVLDVDDPAAFHATELAASLPATAKVSTGKGEHWYFAWDASRPVRNAQKGRRDWPSQLCGCDVRGEGGYVIVPPSPHLNGARYSWLRREDPSEAPEDLMTLVTLPEPIAFIPSPRVHSDDDDAYGLAALQDECLTIESAGDGAQEGALNAAALKIGALVAGGHLTYGTARAELISAGLSMASYDPRRPWTEKQITAKVERGLSDGAKSPRSTGDLEEGRNAANAILAKKRAPAATTGGESIETAAPASVSDHVTSKRTNKAAHDGLPEGWRAGLSEGLRLFVDHCDAIAISPQPWIALGAAIATFGTLAGRRYAGPTGLRTNFYAIGVGASSCGKNEPLKRVAAVLQAADQARMLGASKIASGAAILSMMEEKPSCVFPIDEFGQFMQAIADKKAPKHAVEIVDNLTELYSCARDTFLGTAYASRKDRPTVTIAEPNLSVFGVTTPEAFWSAFSSANALDGSLARFLVFATACDYPDRQDTSGSRAVPDALRAMAVAVAAGAHGHDTFPLGEGAAVVPSPFPVSFADDPARRAFSAFDEKALGMLRSAKHSAMRSIIGKMAENAIKLAALHAITDNPAQPIVTKRAVEWGTLIAQHNADAMMRAAERYVADNDHERRLKKILAFILDQTSDGSWIAKSIITKRFDDIDGRTRDGILRGLVDDGRVKEGKGQPEGGNGRHPVLYQIAP